MNASTSNHAANHTPAVWPPATPAERERLRDQAIARAHQLRAEAISEFWHGADGWFGDAIGQARRSADRLAARLRQHAKQRAAARGSRALEA